MLTILRRIVLEFSQASELDQALLRLVSQVKNALSTQCCSVYLADHEKQHFILMASNGLAENAFGRTCIGFTEGLVGLVGQREEPINIANAHQHPDFIHAPEVEEEHFKAFLGTPIIHQRKVLGILTVQQEQARFFNENEEAFLVTLSAQLATALASVEAQGMIELSYSQNIGKNLAGIGGSPGVAIGEMIVMHPKADLSKIALNKVSDSQQQLMIFDDAASRTFAEFSQMSEKLKAIISDNSLDIFDVYKQLLESDNFKAEVIAKIKLAWNAQSALKLVVDSYVMQFESLEDEYLRERAYDIKDLGNRLLNNIQNLAEQDQQLPEQFILVAEDVSAAMLAEYQHLGLLGIVSITGSNNSHTAILAKALNIPAIMGVDYLAIRQLHKKQAILDGYACQLYVTPADALINEYRHIVAAENKLYAQVKEAEHLPALTQDGHHVSLLINAGLSAGFEYSQNVGADGVGLYRTEIPFMNRSCFPSESEQTVLYQQVLASFPDKPVTMRTLDVGGDKSLPYFPIIEANPFLGWRGIRITLDHPEIFLVQVRAMMKANYGLGNLAIMLPMISSITEVDEANRLINQAYYELTSELFCNENDALERPKVGVMIEVPGIIFQLEDLADKVDFFSVGSNDLTQYLLAVDRNNSRVASLYDFYHPAVLRALHHIAQKSQHRDVPLSICGELANEPTGALLLIAMGYQNLSMSAHSLAKVKWVIRHVDYQQLKQILVRVLSFTNTSDVHSYMHEQLVKLGLGDFVHARLQ
ncbi:phosphoenolpyruvate--protein phosphotransferase [Colwellia sp. MB02u-18]|uniref:phosphoenolpyruvate--protein phosphotransferase n=1 Tax=unclassified Colwellia TaxID=196834 RepID=UPI0015F6267E|nr:MULTISPECIES: phosphoenolpyruvate--protein phosphotransferase [unclassified Colwellia]MBA6223283.1 phosphoenolpyruvate--protein phosphotransferase [Colwellia sp. MB3u-45]MBA6266427.1 phosphoenolpyruvate--protein phosphotransferase [Colwellia sp. MB3u-43]MBA6322442.1 phosphoenolpyruvate--protein phosphotransferase [Colwellia sp. MB02u-19]MBA6324441.1 phosphoenolpyruvate--protein phosphotransferase [Colwellia sp. MB02u-18]MBA6330105.1 phosphoenolpyruvate--protein phosphotransferase [Colwellia